MEKASEKISIKRILQKIIINIAKSSWIPSSQRYRFLKLGGVNIKGPCFIGEDIIIDSIRPDLITIGEGSVITARACIITHFLKEGGMYYGEVHIGNRTFIGMGTMIINSVKIGDNCIIGAGSIVTKDIPDNEIWAGNPAKFIKSKE